MSRECERCERTETEILARKADLYHLCDEDPYSRCRAGKNCTALRCSDCNESIAGSDSYLEYQASAPSLDEQHMAAWLQKEGR